MLSNIYEEPNVVLTERHGREDDGGGGERVERTVDIYESEDGLIGHRARPEVQNGGTRGGGNAPSKQRDFSTAVSVSLGVLCLLLLIWLAVVVKLYVTAVLNEDQLQTELEGMKKALDEMRHGYCSVQEQNQRSRWKRSGCFCFYVSAEKKNWTESRNDCERRNSSLVIVNKPSKQNVVSKLERFGESWMGLEGKTGWNNYRWKWVDESPMQYQGWKTNVNTIPGAGSKAFMDLQGHWDHAQNGSRHWICQKLVC